MGEKSHLHNFPTVLSLSKFCILEGQDAISACSRAIYGGENSTQGQWAVSKGLIPCSLSNPQIPYFYITYGRTTKIIYYMKSYLDCYLEENFQVCFLVHIQKSRGKCYQKEGGNNINTLILLKNIPILRVFALQ